MVIYLIRHGQTLFNQLNLVQGWCDSPLTELGIQQAEKARDLLGEIKIDYAFSSTSERAYDTCRIAIGKRDLKIKKDKRIKELNFGIFEGSLDAYKMYYAHKVAPQIEKGFYEDLRAKGGEDTSMMLERFNDFMNEKYKLYPDSTILLSSHGVALTAFIKQHCQPDLDRLFGEHFFFAKNAAVTKVILDESGYHLEYANKED